VLVAIRGQSALVEVPNQSAPASPPVTRDSSAPSDTHTTPDHTTPDVSTMRVESTTAPQALTISDAVAGALNIPALSHFDSPVQIVPVASVVADVQSPLAVRGDAGGSSGFGDGDLARGSDIAPLALNLSDYADHGWFVVPSASNEYGDVHVAADGFVFDVAAGEFAGDWFLA
jgi:hypothetical protein